MAFPVPAYTLYSLVHLSLALQGSWLEPVDSFAGGHFQTNDKIDVHVSSGIGCLVQLPNCLPLHIWKQVNYIFIMMVRKGQRTVWLRE